MNFSIIFPCSLPLTGLLFPAPFLPSAYLWNCQLNQQIGVGCNGSHAYPGVTNLGDVGGAIKSCARLLKIERGNKLMKG